MSETRSTSAGIPVSFRAGRTSTWLVDPFAGAMPAIAADCDRTLELVEQEGAEFSRFASRLASEQDEVVAQALLESAARRTANLYEHYMGWVGRMNEMVIGKGAVWPDRLDKVLPGFFGAPTGALQRLDEAGLKEADAQIQVIHRLVSACRDLKGAREEYLSLALSRVTQKMTASGYDFDIVANPKGLILSGLWIHVHLKHAPGMSNEGLDHLRQELDDELRELELVLQDDGSLKPQQSKRRPSYLRAVDLRVTVDGEDYLDEPDI